MKKIYKAIARGYALSLQRLDLLIILFVFFGVSYAFEYLPSLTNQNLLLRLLSTVIAFMSISYSLSIPYFFSKTEKDYRHVAYIIGQNAKRLILPALVFFALVFVTLLGVASVLSAMNVAPRAFPSLFTQSVANLNTVLHPSAVILRLFAAMLTFTPIYFSMKQKSIRESLVMSFSYGYQHMGIVIVFFLMQTAYMAITLVTGTQPVIMAIHSIVQLYIGYLITASAYSYFIVSRKD